MIHRGASLGAAILLAASVLGNGCPAAAQVVTQPPTERSHAGARLIAEGPEPDCPTTLELAAKVNQMLGREAVSADPENMRVFWSVAPDEAGVTARFRLVANDDGELGTRSVRADSMPCDALRDRFALVLSLMLDVPRSEAAPPPASRPRPLTWIETEAGAAASVGWLPQPRVGAAIAFRAAPRDLVPVALELTFWPVLRAASGSGDYTLGGWTASLTASPPIVEGRAGRLAVDFGTRWGLMSARGVGFPVSASSSTLVADVVLAIEGAAHLVGPLWVRGAAGPLIALRRPKVVFLTADQTEVEVHRGGQVHGLATVSLMGHF